MSRQQQLIILLFGGRFDELLAKEAIEPSLGAAGFYSSIFVVPKCTRLFLMKSN